MTAAEYRYPDAIVSTAWLADHLEDPALRILECSMRLNYDPSGATPVSSENRLADFEAGHIPGAAYVDLQGEFSDAASAFRFTMLPPDEFARRMGAKGVGAGTRVVLYSRGSLSWSPRYWWMFRAVGFDNVAILDGGWASWAAEGRPQSSAPGAYPPASFAPSPRPELFVGPAEVRAAIGDQGVCTINALGPAIHSGADGRYGRPGRIPGSVNVPADSLQDMETLKLPDTAAAAAAFEAVGADPGKPVIAYCGGGVAATLDAFLMHQLGFTDIAVYDNSMTEWANDPALPIETD